MARRVISLASSRGTFTSGDVFGMRIGAKSRGFGLPPVATQWFEGAGDGATYRGARVLPRVIELEVKSYATNRQAVWEAMSLLARILDPRATEARLTITLDGDEWFVDVRRTGGGDWEQGTDTDGSTFLRTIVTLQAGDPYWQRVDEESKPIVLGGLGRGLIKNTGASDDSLSKLRVSTTAAFGVVTFSNSGDVEADARWKIEAPFTSFQLISPSGETLTYDDAKASGFIVVDMSLVTVVDETGANKYDGLGATPRFWAIPPGESAAQVLVVDATSASKITVIWAPRKWLVF